MRLAARIPRRKPLSGHCAPRSPRAETELVPDSQGRHLQRRNAIPERICRNGGHAPERSHEDLLRTGDTEVEPYALQPSSRIGPENMSAMVGQLLELCLNITVFAKSAQNPKQAVVFT